MPVLARLESNQRSVHTAPEIQEVLSWETFLLPIFWNGNKYMGASGTLALAYADRAGVELILPLLSRVLTAGKELFGLDTLQKSLWIQLLEEMFLGMPSEFPWGDEIMLFLNVFNGALILHPEDSALLRQYAATVINTAVHFNHLFSLSGYQWILPTMLQVPGVSCPSYKRDLALLRPSNPMIFVKKHFHMTKLSPLLPQKAPNKIPT